MPGVGGDLVNPGSVSRAESSCWSDAGDDSEEMSGVPFEARSELLIVHGGSISALLEGLLAGLHLAVGFGLGPGLI